MPSGVRIPSSPPEFDTPPATGAFFVSGRCRDSNRKVASALWAVAGRAKRGLGALREARRGNPQLSARVLRGPNYGALFCSWTLQGFEPQGRERPVGGRGPSEARPRSVARSATRESPALRQRDRHRVHFRDQTLPTVYGYRPELYTVGTRTSQNRARWLGVPPQVRTVGTRPSQNCARWQTAVRRGKRLRPHRPAWCYHRTRRREWQWNFQSCSCLCS